MSRKRLTEEQIIPILTRHEAGISTQELLATDFLLLLQTLYSD